MEELLKSYGAAGGIVGVLSGVIIFLYKDRQKLQDKYDALQDRRYEEARETSEAIIEPLKEQGKLSEKMYDILLNLNNTRKA